MPKACRSTQHCAHHGWCHRCDGRFAALMSEVNLVIQSSKAQPGAWGELYGRIASVLHGNGQAAQAAELAEARRSLQRLNCRAQAAESRLNAVERAVEDWRIDENAVFLPLPSVVAVARAVGVNMEAGSLVSYHEKIEELQAEVRRARRAEKAKGRSMIQERNIYESADPRDNGRKIRVVKWSEFDQKAQIVSHPKGDRARFVQASSLHDKPETKQGERRRTGYFLVGIHEESADA